MFIRSNFVTNSSTTSFVCFGSMYFGSDYTGFLARINELAKEYMPRYREEFAIEEDEPLMYEGELYLYHCAEFIGWVYQELYALKYPEKVKYETSGDGTSYSYVEAPAEVACDWRENSHNPWFAVTAFQSSADWGPTPFNPDKTTKEQKVAIIKEFCELVGIQYIEPEWWMEGYGVR